MMHEWLYSSDTNDYSRCTDYTGDKFNLGKLHPNQVFDEHYYNGVEPQHSTTIRTDKLIPTSNIEDP